MSRPNPPTSAARFIAGILAALWGMLGLELAYSFGSLYGARSAIVVAVAVNVALVTSAALAFVNAGRWRGIMIAAIVAVTADRLFNMIFTGATALGIAIDLLAALAIAAVALFSPPTKPAA